MHRFYNALSVLFICVSIVLIDSCSFAEGIVMVSVVGAPKITKSSNGELRTCRTGMEVNPGDAISTLLDERVDIAMGENANRVIRIDPNSYVIINTQDFVNLSSGTIYAKIKNRPKGSKFEVKTPVAICGARGTGWKVETNDEKSSFSAFENSIYVKGIDQAGNVMQDELIVENGRKVDVAKFEKPEKLIELSDSDKKNWDGWIKDINSISARRDSSIERVDRIVKSAEKIESSKESVKESRDEARLEREERRSPEEQGTTGGGG